MPRDLARLVSCVTRNSEEEAAGPNGHAHGTEWGFLEISKMRDTPR